MTAQPWLHSTILFSTGHYRYLQVLYCTDKLSSTVLFLYTTIGALLEDLVTSLIYITILAVHLSHLTFASDRCQDSSNLVMWQGTRWTCSRWRHLQARLIVANCSLVAQVARVERGHRVVGVGLHRDGVGGAGVRGREGRGGGRGGGILQFLVSDVVEGEAEQADDEEGGTPTFNERGAREQADQAVFFDDFGGLMDVHHVCSWVELSY